MVLIPGNHDICWNTSRLACPGCVGPFWPWVVWRTCLKDSRRFTSMRTLGGAPMFRSNSVMRGLESLHVSATIGPAEPPAPQTRFA